MNPKWQALAGDLLDKVSELLSGRCCNDFYWPEDWTEADKIEIVLAMVCGNAPGKPIDQEEVEHLVRCSPDWWVAKFLARQLKGET